MQFVPSINDCVKKFYKKNPHSGLRKLSQKAIENKIALNKIKIEIEPTRKELYRILEDAVVACNLTSTQKMVLDLYIGCCSPQDKEGLIVYITNKKISSKTILSISTICRTNKQLQDLGLIVAVDRKGYHRGRYLTADGYKHFGFDLSPLLKRREELSQMAFEVQKQKYILEDQKRYLDRTDLQIKQYIETLQEIGNEQAYQEAQNAYLELSKKKRTQDTIPSLLGEYAFLLKTVEKAFDYKEKTGDKIVKMTTLPSQNDNPYISKIITNINIDSKIKTPECSGEHEPPQTSLQNIKPEDGEDTLSPADETFKRVFQSKSSVLDLVDSLERVSKVLIDDNINLIIAADLGRLKLGIREELWEEVKKAFTPLVASEVLALIWKGYSLGRFNSGAGYLMILLRKHKQGKFRFSDLEKIVRKWSKESKVH